MGSRVTNHKQISLSLLGVCLVLGATLQACDFFRSHENEEDAQAALAFSGSSCGINAYAQVLWPQAIVSCGQCHDGSGQGNGMFANSVDINGAHADALTKVNFSNVSLSKFVQKASNASHGNGNCSDCGAAFGQAFQSLVAEWAEAELGLSNCSTYAALQSGSFDPGIYNPGGAFQPTFLQAGYDEFNKPAGVRQFLQTHCVNCHAPGQAAAFAPFAGPDTMVDYFQAKVRIASTSALSKLYNRAALPGHGSNGCVACGNMAIIGPFGNSLDAWIAIEAAGLAVRVDVQPAMDLPNLPMAPPTQRIQWSLAAAGFPGAVFSVAVTTSSTIPGAWLLVAPRIDTAGAPIHVKDIRFFFGTNGPPYSYISTGTAFASVDTTIPAGQTPGPTLSVGTLILLQSATPNLDQIYPTFDTLE